MKIRFHRKLYKGRMVLNAGKAVKMLSKGKTSPLLYCIVRSPDGRSVELVSSGWFSQPWYEDREIYVVGIASGWKDGIELLSSIMQETVSGTGDTDIVRYLFPGEDINGGGA